MAQEDVEFLKNLFAGVGEMDRKALLAALPELIPEVCDPEIEWHEDPQRADGVVHRGHAGVLRSWERWLEGFDEYDAEIEEIVDYGAHVLVTAREHARGAASGARVSSLLFGVYTFRDGKIVRYREFSDEALAREAAGSQVD